MAAPKVPRGSYKAILRVFQATMYSIGLSKATCTSTAHLSLMRPFMGLIRPLKGLVRQFKSLIRPSKGLIRHSKGLIRLFKGPPAQIARQPSRQPNKNVWLPPSPAPALCSSPARTPPGRPQDAPGCPRTPPGARQPSRQPNKNVWLPPSPAPALCSSRDFPCVGVEKMNIFTFFEKKTNFPGKIPKKKPKKRFPGRLKAV